MVDNTVHDLVITDVTKETTAYTLSVESVTGNFTVGETVVSNNSGEAEVLEWDSENNKLYVGSFGGNAFVATNTLTGQTSNATATISASGVSSAYDWHTAPANVKTLASAKLITSAISGQVSGTNLWTNPEAFASNWQSFQLGGVNGINITNNAGAAPDLTTTAEKIFAPNNQGGVHQSYRDYSLNSFETFDTSTVKFDSDTETFDTGATGTAVDDQTFTYSAFFKAAGSQSVRFGIILDDGTSGEQNIFFDINLTNGVIGSLFTPQGGITGDAYGVVPYGDGWYRAYITTTFGFGFSSLRGSIILNSATGAQSWTGDGSDWSICLGC